MAITWRKKIEYKNVEKIFIFNFFEESAKFKRACVNEFTFCEHEIDVYENLSLGFFKRYSKGGMLWI